MPLRDVIRIRGARQHNLKAVDVDIPLGALTVITGVSGSGKSSLAFDTLYAEGQRRYVETFSAYARQFLERMDRPDVDGIEGIPPAVAIERSRPIRGSRSTVGTMSELLDHLKLLWAKVGELACPGCERPVTREGPEHAADVLGALPAGRRLLIGFGLRMGDGRGPADAAEDLRAAGFGRVVSSDGRIEPVRPDGAGLPASGSLFVLVDRVVTGRTKRSRLVDSLETAFRGGGGRAEVRSADREDGEALCFSAGLHCAFCDRDFRPPTPNLFSFNSPIGACATCHGFGRTSGIDWDLVVPDPARTLARGAIKPFQTPSKRRHQRKLIAWCREAGVPTDVPWRDLDGVTRQAVLQGKDDWYGVAGFFQKIARKSYKVHVRVLLARYRGYPPCPDCGGARLALEGRAWRVGGRTLPEVLALDVGTARAFFDRLRPAAAEEVVDLLLQEIRTRLECLDAVGLGYLSLDRQARTLSGGEVQRVNLTAAIGTNLVGTLFVLDEPSVGLHPRDTGRLVAMLRRLRDQGNTVVVVEHDPGILAAADHVIDLGPGAGESGGYLVAAGTPAALKRARGSLTGAYLAGRRRVDPGPRRAPKPAGAPSVGVLGARAHNLRGIDLSCRLGELTVLSGVSGSGKSSLAHDVLYLAVARALGRPEGTPGPHDAVVGAESVADVVLVDQGAVGRSRRANVATYIGAWTGIRNLFGKLVESTEAGYTPSTFSFNVAGGRCERCEGEGVERVEMQFLSDVEVTCPDCDGTRFRPEVRAIRWDGLGIADVLELTVEDARARFAARAPIRRALDSLAEVGLGYLRLGQSLATLSSGEAQRLRLAAALKEEVRGKPSLWVFDEPTTGLHLEDVAVLVKALRRLAEGGHAVLVVEHHLDVMHAADRLVDLGPEGGDAGGEIVADGPPDVVARGTGATAQFLRAATPGEPTRRRRRRPVPPSSIEIHGAREHNLKNVAVDLPRDQLVVVSGPSGSGKSTLAFDIVFAEGQRRYIETLSAYARQFVGQLARPEVDHVGGIPPTVAIEQRRTRGGRRSTVATITEVSHFLRLLFARAGVPHCPRCDETLEALPRETLHDRILSESAGTLRLLAPVVLGRKGFHRDVFERLARQGLTEARVDGSLVPVEPTPALQRYQEHDVEAVVGTLRIGATPASEAHAMIDRALELGKGTLLLLRADGTSRRLSTSRTCPRDGATVPELDPRFFSSNSHRGWCAKCRGLGVRPTVDAALLPIDETLSIRRGAIRPLAMDDELHRAFVKAARDDAGASVGVAWSRLPARTRRLLLHGGRHAGKPFVGAADRLARWLDDAPEIAVDWLGQYAQHAACPTCGGTRLRPEARAVRVGGSTLPGLLALPVDRFLSVLASLPLEGRDAAVAAPILREIRDRLGFLARMGLGYMALERAATTLSGGETQRIRLAAQLGSNLRGVCYVLDEPTIGLHVRDNARLLDALEELRDRGNSLVVVEHDADTIRRADRVIDLGPGGGRHGGHIVATGTPEALEQDPDSPTGRVLARTLRLPRSVPGRADDAWLEVDGARLHNLRDLDVRLPLGRLVAVTGVSGSGKSTLVREVVYGGVRHVLAGDRGRPAHCRRIRGVAHLGRALEVDATPIGKTPRSVPATYLSIWDEIRKALARTPEARTRGYGPGRFSFNVKEGRCPACDGRGRIRIEMSFLPDVEVPCESCGGKRFTDETLEVTWRGRSAAELLEMTFEEAAELFRDFPRIAPFTELMRDVGLGYLQLGQPSTTLSGGEAQRLKLVTELGRPSRSGEALYVLDEPTTGLHGEDVDRLLAVLRRFVERGDTVLVIEHDLDFIVRCDHVIDLGPEGGEGGGRVVAQGTPRQVARARKRSHTGRALADVFASGRVATARGVAHA